MVFLFSLTASLLFADQNLLAPNLSMAGDFFGFADNERDSKLGGFISAAFFITGAPAALLVGFLADKMNRRNLLFYIVVLGEAPCLCTYWVTEYWQFFFLRTLTGISVGGCFPLIFSLLGDLFPISRRNVVSASVAISTGAGVAAGQALSGWLGPATGDWRVPFVVVAAPAMVVSIVMLITCYEPPRGAFEEALREQYADGQTYTETISWAKVKVLLRIPSNMLIIAQGLPGSLPWGMILTFFNDFLATPPPNGKDLGTPLATLIILIFGLGGGIGVIGGGLGGQYLYNRKKEYLPILMGVSVVAGMGPLYYLVNVNLANVALAGTFIIALIGGACSGIAGANLRAIILNVNEPETRGVALALQSMTDDVGKGLGPVFVAIFIRALGRQSAFNVAVAGWLPAAIMLGCLYWHIRRDEDRMQARLQGHAAAAAAARAGENATPVSAAGEGPTTQLLLLPSTQTAGPDGQPGDLESARGARQRDSNAGAPLLAVNDSHTYHDEEEQASARSVPYRNGPGLLSRSSSGTGGAAQHAPVQPPARPPGQLSSSSSSSSLTQAAADTASSTSTVVGASAWASSHGQGRDVREESLDAASPRAHNLVNGHRAPSGTLRDPWMEPTHSGRQQDHGLVDVSSGQEQRTSRTAPDPDGPAAARGAPSAASGASPGGDSEAIRTRLLASKQD